MNLINHLLFPLRVVLPQSYLEPLHLYTLSQERTFQVLPYVSGQLIDIGCGSNLLVKSHGQGVGVDIHPWPGVDLVCDTRKLPFPNHSFHTASLLACLNHIPRSHRPLVLREIHRVLKPHGQLLITMISPLIGWTCHRIIAHWDPDQTQRSMHPEEEWGLSSSTVMSLIHQSGFRLDSVRPFSFLHLNHLYIATRL